MIVLKENKAILHLMGLIPGIGVYLPVAVWSIPLITLLLPMIAYSIVNIHDVRKATDASYVIAADILCTGQYWFLAAQKTNLLNVLNHLDRLVAERKSSPGFIAFEKTEKKIRFYTKAMKVFVITSSSMCLFLPIFVAGFFYLRGTYSPSVWYLPYKAVMPFDDSTVIGYTLTMINQLLGSWMTCLVICNVDSLFFGVCFYIETMLNDKLFMLNEIDEYLEDRKKMVRSAYLKEQLKKIIVYHTKILDFANEFESLMSGIVFVTFSTSIMWICTSLFQIQANLQHTNYFLLMQCCVTTIAVILIIMIFCYFGNMVTAKFSDVATRAYASYWYKYPIELQPYIIMLMNQSQNEFLFKGLKFNRCSLDSFTNIINRSSQIFMLFRSIE